LVVTGASPLVKIEPPTQPSYRIPGETEFTAQGSSAKMSAQFIDQSSDIGGPVWLPLSAPEKQYNTLKIIEISV
jgi:hypothetical protein